MPHHARFPAAPLRRPTLVLTCVLAAALLAACGGGGGDVAATGQAVAVVTPAADHVSTADATATIPDLAGTDTGADAAVAAAPAMVSPAAVTAAATTPTLPGFQFAALTLPDPANGACSGAGNASATLGLVHVGQTHLMAPSHPFFHLTVGRPAWVRASVTGSGPSPEVSVEATIAGRAAGRICLKGPADLPAKLNESRPAKGSSFLGALPAAWMQPGLSLTVRAGNAVQTLDAAALRLGPSPELTLVTADWLLFGDTEPTPFPKATRTELLERLPLAGIHLASFPGKIKVAKLPIAVRSDGYSPTGTVGTQPAVLATGLPHCSATDKSAGTCAPWSGFGVLAAVRSLTGELQSANGMSRLSHWYGALSLNRHVGGGLGGGVTGSGDNYDLVFNHELGHAFDMPHWGDSLYSRVSASATQAHPYTGSYGSAASPQGGGVGDTTAIDASSGQFNLPVCAATSTERQEPMQRGANSPCLPTGQTFDHFSDYSALFIHRYFVGASTPYSGTVTSPRDLTGNKKPRFAFPTKSGRPNLAWTSGSTTPKIMEWDATSQSYVERTPARVSSDSRIYGENYPLQWNVPVYTLWGSFSNATPAANFIQTPLHYQGNLMRLWDPTQDADFAAMKNFISGDGFWWGADLVVQADFADGSVRRALVKRSARSTDPLNGGSFTYWAINIPAPDGVKLTKVSLYYRPMEVRYGDGGNTSSSYYTPTNLNSTLNKTLTAAQYLSTARLVTSRSF